MFIQLPEIKINNFINSLRWYEAGCFNRIMLFLLESIRKNSMYYYILFHEKIIFFPEHNIWNFMFEKCEIQFKEHVLSLCKNDIDKYLQQIIEEKKYAILCFDQYYRKEAVWYYQKRHHPHFAILKGYNSDLGRYLILAEDAELRNFSPTTIPYGFTYKYSWEPREYFEQVLRLNELEYVSVAKKDDLFVRYYEMLPNCTNLCCDIHAIENEYKQHLLNLLSNYDKLKNVIMTNLFNDFNIKKNNGREWYEYESLIKKHHTSVELQIIFWTYLYGEKVGFPSISSKYDIIRSLFSKLTIKKDDNILNRIINMQNECFDLEKEFFRKILCCLDSSVFHLKNELY